MAFSQESFNLKIGNKDRKDKRHLTIGMVSMLTETAHLAAAPTAARRAYPGRLPCGWVLFFCQDLREQSQASRVGALESPAVRSLSCSGARSAARSPPCALGSSHVTRDRAVPGPQRGTEEPGRGCAASGVAHAQRFTNVQTSCTSLTRCLSSCFLFIN